MKFLHKPLNIPKARLHESKTERYYLDPEGRKLPSVSEVLSKFTDKSWLDAWKNRVGEAEAKKASNKAISHGKGVHKVLEYYIETGEILRSAMPSHIFTAKQMIRNLDAHLTAYYAIEQPLYSWKLNIAGTADLLGEWNNVPSVIDHKTSKYPVLKENITHYFIQKTFYSLMVEEHTGIKLDNLVTNIGVGSEYNGQVFEESRSKFESEALRYAREFYN